MHYSHITHPHQFPWEWRVPGMYRYLDKLDGYWPNALDVAHELLTSHATLHGRDTYYQDQFGDDFVSAIRADHMALPLEKLATIEVDFNQPRHGHINCWTEHRRLKEALQMARRGAHFHIDARQGDRRWWSYCMTVGPGQLCSHANTGTRNNQQFSDEEMIRRSLGYEAYLARQQAEQENRWLSNYTNIRELGLRAGQKLHDVEMSVEYKRRRVNFVIERITDQGHLEFTGGTYAGSRNRLAGQIAAVMVKEKNLGKPTISAPIVAGTCSTLAMPF